MKIAGGVIGIVAGFLGLIDGFATAFLGELGKNMNAKDADTAQI